MTYFSNKISTRYVRCSWNGRFSLTFIYRALIVFYYNARCLISARFFFFFQIGVPRYVISKYRSQTAARLSVQINAINVGESKSFSFPFFFFFSYATRC